MFCFNFNTFYFCAHADQWFCFLLSFGVFFLGSRLLRRIILNLAWFALLAFNIFYYTTFCYFSVYFIYRCNINGAEMVLMGNVNANHSIINDTLAMKLYSNIKIFSFMVCSFQFIDFVWVFYSLLGFFSDSKMKRKKNRFIIDTEVFFSQFSNLMWIIPFVQSIWTNAYLVCSDTKWQGIGSSLYLQIFNESWKSKRNAHILFFVGDFFFVFCFCFWSNAMDNHIW